MSRSPCGNTCQGRGRHPYVGAVPRSGASDPAQVNGGDRDGFAALAHGAIGDVDACCVHATGPSWRESLPLQVAHGVSCSSSRAKSEHDPLGDSAEIGAVAS